MDEMKSKFAPTSCQKYSARDVIMREGNTWQYVRRAWGFKSMDVFLLWHFIQGFCVEVGCCLLMETNDSSAFFLSESMSTKNASSLRPFRKEMSGEK